MSPPSEWFALLLVALVVGVGPLAGALLGQQGPREQMELMRESGPDTLNMISARGFKGEIYFVRSRDGAMLSMYRIVNPAANPRQLNSLPVLMFHGLAGDTSQMISRSTRSKPRAPIPGQMVASKQLDDCLAFMLANNNFETFMVDARGTNLNNHHASADLDFKESQKVWNFTLNEEALLDLPAAIDFVLRQTGAPKLHYIGFSESTFFVFALMASSPEYQLKFASVTALAPVAYVNHIRGTALTSLMFTLSLPDEISANIMPQTLVDSVGAYWRKLCEYQIAAHTVCAAMLRGMSGVGQNQDPGAFYQTTFKSTSMKAIKHFIQLYKQQRFGMYDYGPAGNLRQYGQVTPPNFDLSRIHLPTLILVRGHSDFLSTPEDQELLLSQLGTKPYLDLLLPKYNHLDFLLADNLFEEVNLPLLKAIWDITRAHNDQLLPGAPMLFRDSTQPLPNKAKPAMVVLPGQGSIRVHDHLASNLMTGLERAAKRSPGGALFSQPLGLLTQFGRLTDGFQDQVRSLADPLLGPKTQ